MCLYLFKMIGDMIIKALFKKATIIIDTLIGMILDIFVNCLYYRKRESEEI